MSDRPRVGTSRRWRERAAARDTLTLPAEDVRRLVRAIRMSPAPMLERRVTDNTGSYQEIAVMGRREWELWRDAVDAALVAPSLAGVVGEDAAAVCPACGCGGVLVILPRGGPCADPFHAAIAAPSLAGIGEER